MNRLRRRLYGRRIWTLTLEGLILAKEAAGRPKDLALLPELRALQALREETQQEGS